MKFFSTLLLCAFAFVLSACAPKFKAPRISPDGKLTIFSTLESSHRDETLYGCVIIELQDQTGKILLRENTGASAFQRWDIQWISNDEFKLSSADTGDSTWKRRPDGNWQKQ